MTPLAAEILTLARNRHLLALLARRELLARNAGTALGFAWLYIQPLGLLTAYFYLFDFVFGLRLGEGAGATRLGVYLVVGMVAWLAFVDAMQRGMGSIVETGDLLQKNPLPPVLFPARAVLASATVYLPFFVVLLMFAFVRNGFGLALPAMVLVLAFQTLFFFLMAYLLSLLVAAMRDVQQVAAFALAIGLFCSPVLYPPEFLPEGVRWLLWLNPMTPFVLAWQDLALVGRLPPIHVWGALAAWTLACAGVLSSFVSRAHEQLVDWL